jgi:DNA-directed RNA polymerase subunit RPC12/RpoP
MNYTRIESGYKIYKCEECSYTTTNPHPPNLYSMSTNNGWLIVCKKCFIKIHKSLGQNS